MITALAIVFSIVNIEDLNDHNAMEKLSDYQMESVIILALSSFITMLTLFFSNKNYSERAAKYQSNYMELTRLLADIQNLMVYYKLQNYDDHREFKYKWKEQNPKKNLEKRLAKKYKMFADKYASLLTQSENHEDIDYIKACLDETNDEIASLEKKYFGNISFKREIANILSNSEDEIKINYYKEILELRPKEPQYNPFPMELSKLYEKQSNYEQIIAEAKFKDIIKYIFIGALPIILVLIFKFFRAFLVYIN